MKILLRPKRVLGTPKRLAEALGYRLRFYPNPKRKRILDFRTDFLYTLPAIQDVENAPRGFVAAVSFFRKNKAEQRWVLHMNNIPVPKWATTHDEALDTWPRQDPGRPADAFIVRPLHHHQGKNYRTTGDPIAFTEGREYIQEVFPKTREYRIIYVFGKPLILIRKKPVEGLGVAEAWNHDRGSIFQTVNNVDGSRLKKNTTAFDDLAEFLPIRNCHICAVDILYTKRKGEDAKYVVCEVNSWPGITIDENIDTIVQEIRRVQP